jgi:hypothetical protein
LVACLEALSRRWYVIRWTFYVSDMQVSNLIFINSSNIFSQLRKWSSSTVSQLHSRISHDCSSRRHSRRLSGIVVFGFGRSFNLGIVLSYVPPASWLLCNFRQPERSILL